MVTRREILHKLKHKMRQYVSLNFPEYPTIIKNVEYICNQVPDEFLLSECTKLKSDDEIQRYADTMISEYSKSIPDMDKISPEKISKLKDYFRALVKICL